MILVVNDYLELKIFSLFNGLKRYYIIHKTFF
jgi:hypothetical protein